MVEKFTISKTNHNGRDYWLLYVTKTTGTDLKKFNSKLEATEYFLDNYGIR